jgi:hypothetical protein
VDLHRIPLAGDVLETPVVLIVFRRPALTARVLDAIARVRPRHLLVVADGPRPDRPDDADACAATRAVIDRVDWECKVLRHYSDVNLGCGRRPASGISWAFQHVDEAIVLEDDCVPEPSFFRYCEELLERYRHDERVMHIAGSTYRAGAIDTPYSYFFSQFNGAWGWATWKRAWKHFDAAVALWPALRHTSWLPDLVEDARAVEYWSKEFETAWQRGGDVSYWDHQWTFACWAHSGLSIMPRANLVSNVGCGPDATHMVGEADVISNVPATPMAFPLVHPPNVLQRRDADRDFLRRIVLPRLARPSPLRVLASRVTPKFAKQGYRRLASAVASTTTHHV